MLVQLKALLHEAFFFFLIATCNANLCEKDNACSCRILDIMQVVVRPAMWLFYKLEVIQDAISLVT